MALGSLFRVVNRTQPKTRVETSTRIVRTIYAPRSTTPFCIKLPCNEKTRHQRPHAFCSEQQHVLTHVSIENTIYLE